MKTALFASLLITVCVFSACTMSAKTTDDNSPATETEITELLRDSREWVVEDINSAGVTDGFRATLKFDDNQVSGSTGCNRYSGRFTTEGPVLKVGPMMASRRACPPAIMDLESKFLRLFDDDITVTTDQTGALFLTSPTGSVTAR